MLKLFISSDFHLSFIPENFLDNRVAIFKKYDIEGG